MVEGHLLRPFCLSAGIKARDYSLPLQRRITDFGADTSFARAWKKLKEHYGISIPVSSIRTITERHAKDMKDNEKLNTDIPDDRAADHVIAEVDGAMIPIVDTFKKTDTEEKTIDKRKTRKVRWAEGRLALAHQKGSTTPVFGATMGDKDDAGNQLAHCAILSGAGEQTKIHCVGDGAAWISEQVDRVFGPQATFLIDFYHLCDYLAAASKTCAPDNPSAWIEEQKKRMKENNTFDVVNALKSHIEPDTVPDKDAAVRKCYRYIINRAGQFDYKGALDADLPIGSGEIESAHRYVTQERLKIAGAWWKEDNAGNMLSLRTLRANNNWDDYWESFYKKAA